MAERAVPRALLRECMARHSAMDAGTVEAVLDGAGVPLVVSESAMSAFVLGAPAGAARDFARVCQAELFPSRIKLPLLLGLAAGFFVLGGPRLLRRLFR